MYSDWPQVRLGDRCHKIGSGATPRGGANVYLEDGPRFIRSQNVHDLRFDFRGLAHLDQSAAEQLRGAAVQPGDVLINITGDSVARVCLAPGDGAEARVSQHVAIIRPDPTQVASRYLAYWLVSPHIKAHLLMLASAGATRKALTKGMLCKLEFPLVPLEEQYRILSVLATLDDKIDSNSKLAALLEESVSTVFRARFIDFLGIEVQESEIGRIPTGWKVGPLTDALELFAGGTPSTSKPQYWEGDIPWISVKDTLPGPYVTATEKHVSETALKEARLNLYPRDTVVVTARGTVGNVALMADAMTLNQSCYAVRGSNGAGQLYVYFILRRAVDTLRARSHGSVFSTITRRTFESVNVAQPPHDVMAEFERDASPLFELIRSGALESATLATIRDTLLPKFISGEIRVPDTNDPGEVIGPAAEQLAEASA